MKEELGEISKYTRIVKILAIIFFVITLPVLVIFILIFTIDLQVIFALIGVINLF
jgi:hypothetical protein